MKMKKDVLRTAVELNIIFSNESSILVSLAIRKDHEIIRHCSEYFGARAFSQSRTLFLQMSYSYSRGKRMMSFSGCNADDSGLHFLLDTKELSVVLFSVIVVSLQKKIPKLMHKGFSNTLFDSCVVTESVSSWKRKDRNIVQIEDDITASFKEKK